MRRWRQAKELTLFLVLAFAVLQYYLLDVFKPFNVRDLAERLFEIWQNLKN